MKNSQRTIYGTDLALSKSFGLDYNFKNGTTLNNLLDILSNEQYPSGVYPTIKYICIGTGGDDKVDGSAYPFSQHQAKDAGLFRMVPFIARKLTEDLDDKDRIKYRLRKVLSVDGVEYAFYFLRVIDKSDLVESKTFMQFNHSDTQEEIMQPIDFSNSKTILRPVPVNKVDLVYGGSVNYITKMLVLKLWFSKSELEEISEAIKLYSVTEFGLEPNPSFTLREIGLCHGVDGVNVIGDKSYVEAIGTQINMHIGFNVELSMYIGENADSDNGIRRSLSLGGMEPLYVR